MGKSDIVETLLAVLKERAKKVKVKNNRAEILACQANIAKRLSRLHQRSSGQQSKPKIAINNEATVRYAYGDPIVEMIIDSFDYKLEIEENIVDSDDALVDVSSGSRTDYCIWRLYNDSGSGCITILETKHMKKIEPKHYAQILGYYCANKAANDRTGIAILLNEYDDNITIAFFIFPYVDFLTVD